MLFLNQQNNFFNYKMYEIIFSTVIYKTPIKQINKLLQSIESLNKYLELNSYKKYKIELHIFENTPSNESITSKLQFHKCNFNCTINKSKNNIGYGQGHNKNLNKIFASQKKWFFAINPDISFSGKTLYKFIEYIFKQKNITCAAPLIFLTNKNIQFSAKNYPTFLSLITSRFSFFQTIPQLRSYLYKNQNRFFNYKKDIIHAPFLSGCFLAFPSFVYKEIGGFDKKYFLHFEDADIVRRCNNIGRTIHCPYGSVVHIRGRGSHKSLSQQFFLIKSYIIYSTIWGFKFK